MTLTNPPPAVTAIHNMLIACASWPVGGTTWYPSAADTQSGNFAVIAEMTNTRDTFAHGVSGIISGSLIVSLHLSDTIGNAEVLARQLALELSAQNSGLPLRNVQSQMAQDPGPSQVAGGEIRRVIEITIDYGLTA